MWLSRRRDGLEAKSAGRLQRLRWLQVASLQTETALPAPHREPKGTVSDVRPPEQRGGKSVSSSATACAAGSLVAARGEETHVRPECLPRRSPRDQPLSALPEYPRGSGPCRSSPGLEPATQASRSISKPRPREGEGTALTFTLSWAASIGASPERQEAGPGGRSNPQEEQSIGGTERTGGVGTAKPRLGRSQAGVLQEASGGRRGTRTWGRLPGRETEAHPEDKHVAEDQGALFPGTWEPGGL